MNCLTVEHDGRLLVIDCGVMFPPRDLPGIDVIHPSFQFLVSRRDDIEAVVLTHGHEDHLAGIPYLLRELDVPVAGTGFAANLMAARLRESDNSGRLDFRRLDVGGRIQAGPFTVSSFAMPHSIVENTGLVIETSAGRILHTGDFRLGLRGPAGGRDVLERLAAVAAPGVDLMICDSTGAEEREPAGEESEVTATLRDLIGGTRGRVFVAIFSSNIRRLEALIGLARDAGRRVVLCGRSVNNHLKAALEAGIISLPHGVLAPLNEAAEIPAGRLLVVISGTQGEARSALGRIAAEGHPQLTVEPGDLVVLSSRFIPGNELVISGMIDRLLLLGARVVHRGNLPGVHVSGHGSQGEIRMAIEAVRPRSFLPAHGTYRHLSAAVELARAAGVEQALAATDGQVVRLGPDGPRIEPERVPAGRVYIDGGAGLPESAIRDRRLIGGRGALVASFAMDGSGRIIGRVEVLARGVVAEDSLPWLEEQVRLEVRRLLGALDPGTRADADRCRDALRSGLRRFVQKRTSREPWVGVTVVRLEE
ncbi:MAG TPA: ribonuclease J [Polyangia bacterium]|nr:ribonuclease J [Polyangia bacterium]